MQKPVDSGWNFLGRIVVGQRTDIVIRFFTLLTLVLMVSAWPPGTEAAEPYPDPASEMWLEVRESADPKLLESFIEAFPDSPYAHAARARLERLKAGPAAAETPPDGEESFIITYPAPGTAKARRWWSSRQGVFAWATYPARDMTTKNRCTRW